MSKLNEVLKNYEKIAREAWNCKKYVQLQDDRIKEHNLQPDLSFKEESWYKFDEDLIANDWKVLTDDDITFFTLSAADLKKYDVSNEIIEKIKANDKKLRA